MINYSIVIIISAELIIKSYHHVNGIDMERHKAVKQPDEV
tara:strand:- start:5319 stop:5438 length:120 start_codon:yes stop_codon:yes gene_type:complete